MLAAQQVSSHFHSHARSSFSKATPAANEISATHSKTSQNCQFAGTYLWHIQTQF
jgi:hypothetical protein